jgi:preprotein translocase subunit SecG
MYIALTIVHVLMCFGIIAIVLLQSGKGADIGSAFGGAGSQAVFGSMGTPTVLGKITGGIAILFTLTSFTLALMGGDRGSSVIREPAPVAPAAPATSGAPATPSGGPATPPAAGSPPAPAAPATK